MSFTDMATTMLNVPARTAAGQQLVSRQAIERGAGIEDLAVSDLMRQIATVIDTQLVTATGSAGSQGIVAIAQGTTYTDGSPTPDKLLPYLYQSESLLEKALLGRAVPDYVAMRSEHWNWICSQVSASHPWLVGQADQQAGAVAVSREYGAVRGVLPNGLKVLVDNNIGTDTPAVLMLASGEIHMYEDPSAPVLIRAEQPSAASLGVLLVAYSYFAFCVERYTNAAGKVTGTGVAIPAGY